MRENKIRYLLIIMIFAAIILLAIPTGIWSKKNVQDLQKRHDSRLTPIIMIPGSSASVNRFDALVRTINERTQTNHSLLKVKVMNDGTIQYSGAVKSGDLEPFIVVGFENNRDGYNNIRSQAKMFNRAFRQLKLRYDFNNFRGIGHSNGGLIYTAFLENYYKNDNVKITRLMTIGSPYNFAETRNRPTQMLQDFIKNRKNLPENLIMYSVAGTQNYVADGLVPVSSVEAGKFIYQGQVKHYTQITVTGRLAQHSALPQNTEVLSLIERYILK
ncbi:alpha/beta hydrolase [Lactobacillus sp. LL6]|uniref:alpha/beta hydrolase n=1 Tax=Lactobacillus sp. LL6 TaxID=2596827 RepID=UPI001184D444|nr:alpha/beta hydrolase [Lactobacillus sp. LL6]TSO27070.1 alpha/beta hydrolase [Lactobacillus sp. LL6]